MGATKLMTAAGGGITLDAASTASDKTITVPARTGNMAVDGPAFSAYRATQQNVTTSVFTKVQCDTEEFDTNSNYDSATNYRFTPTVAGYYQINGCVNFTSSTSKGEMLITIYKNGSEFKRGAYITLNTTNNENITVSGLIYFNGSTDYVELYAYLQGVGTPGFTGGYAQTYFQGSMVRAA